VHGREGRWASLAQYIQLGRSAFAHAARTNSLGRENDEISLFAEFTSLFRRRKFPVLCMGNFDRNAQLFGET
jgi:hypothetical protein